MPSDEHTTGNDAHERPPNATSRRRLMQIMGVGAAAGIAGCSGGDGTPTGTNTGTDVDGFGDDDSSPTPTETVEELPEVGGTYTDVISGDIQTLNSVYNTEATAGGLIATAIHGAYTFKPGQRLFPLMFDLSSDDNQVWTAKLRENMRWSDPYGDVTAEDYVYLIKNVHQSDWAGSSASSDWVQNGEPIPVEKTGKYSFRLELAEADPLFPKKPVTWGMQVIPKQIAKKYVDSQDAEGFQQDEELLNLEYTGNLGPYKLEEWERQSALRYTRNENYFMRELAEDDSSDVPRRWAEGPYFDEYVSRVIPEPSSRVSAIKTGEVDEVGLEPSQAVNLEGTDGLYINKAPQPYNRPVFYNMRENGWKPFRKQGVRQAFGCAVDKRKYVKGIQRNYAQVEFTWQPPWSPWYSDEVANNVAKYGVGDLYGKEAARSRMKDALSGTKYGYSGGQLVDGNGEQVELSLKYQAGQQIEEDTGQYLKQEYEKNLGVKINLSSVQPGTFVTDYWRQQVPENADELEWSKGVYNAGPRDVATSKEPWDMGLIFGLNTYPMTPGTGMVFFQKDSYYNPFGYYPSWDAESVDEKLGNATSTEEYQQALNTMFIQVSKDQPMGMLSLGSELTAYTSSVQGPQEEFFNGWNFPAWYKE